MTAFLSLGSGSGMYPEVVRQRAAIIAQRSRLGEKFERILTFCPPSTWLNYAACVEFSNARYILLGDALVVFIVMALATYAHTRCRGSLNKGACEEEFQKLKACLYDEFKRSH